FFDYCGRRRRDSDMVMTLSASVLEAHVLPDEQAGRLVIELLADLLAERLADFAAARTKTLRFGQRMLDPPTRQISRELLATVAGAFRLGHLRSSWVVGRGCRRHRFAGGGSHLWNQPGLIRIKAFRLGPIQPTQQLIQAML